MFIELIKGVSLLLALSYLQTFNTRLWRAHPRVEEISSGVLFGGICVVGMNLPIDYGGGVIFDARSVIIGMAGVFGGPVVALVSATIAGAYRAWLGGGGMYVGVAVVVSCALLGAAYHFARQKGWVDVSWWKLLLFGLIVHLWVIFLFTFLPPEAVDRVMREVALPFVLTFTPATALLGLLLKDIEQRFATERALRDRETELSLHVRNTPLAAVGWDRNFITTQWNKSAERIFGYTAEEAIGRPANELIIPDGIVADLGAIFDSLLAQKGGEYNINENVTKDGRTIICEWYNTPIVGRDGAIAGVASLALDITDRIKTEQDLEEALAEAERANQVKSEFLARLSHELRTPLNAIIGFSEVLRMRFFGPLGNEKYEEYVQNIHVSGKHLLELINDVLDISEIEAGERKIFREPLNIAEIVKEANDIVRPSAEQRSIGLVVDLPDKLPELNADRRALKQILLNLLSNSIKYSDRDTTVTTRVEVKADAMVFEVTDSGIGIAADLLPTITDVFNRGTSNAQLAQDGTGLGLAIVDSLVEAHGGTLDIQSAVGVGTTVRVTLPFQATSAEERDVA